MGDNPACLPPIGSKIPPFCHKFSLLLSWLLPRNRDTENQVAVLKLLVCVGKFEGQKEQERDFRRATEVQYSNTALDIWITKWGDTLSPFYRFDNFDVNYFTPLQNSDLQNYLASQTTYPSEHYHGHDLQVGQVSYPKPMDKTPASVQGGSHFSQATGLKFVVFFLDKESLLQPQFH